MFLFGLIGASLALWSVLPMPDVPEVRAKLAWLAAHGNEYDTIFIGSSRVRRQISPAIFDARMREQGVPTRSYNLGIDAMTFPELGYVLELFLERKPRRLRFVVADLNALRRKLGPANEAESLRAVYWHDLRRTAEVCEAIWLDASKGEPWSEALPLIQGHLALMLRHYSNLGRGTEFLPWATRPDGRQIKREKKSRGFYPVDAVIPQLDRAAYEDQMALKRTSGDRPMTLDPVLERSLQQFTARVESVGARAFFFVGATMSTRRLPQPQAINGLRPVTFIFDDPSRFPELFNAEHRYDLQHLNRRGAEIFTAMLADSVAAQLGMADR